MASAQRIYGIYAHLFEHANEVRDFQIAAGEKVSGTVELMLSGNREKMLRRWGEEMGELCGVIDGSHKDPYMMEATQCFYWASLFYTSGGVSWEDIDFDNTRLQVGQCNIDTPAKLNETVDKIVEHGCSAGLEKISVTKLFLLWHVADRLYRESRPHEKQWTIEQMMEYDLTDMKKRAYLEPILKAVPEN